MKASTFRDANCVAYIIATILLSAFPAYTQTRPPSSTEQKPVAPAAPVNPDRKEPAVGAYAQGGIEVLSDTQGVDFDPYLKAILPHINDNWHNLLPPEVYPPAMKKGDLTIEFSILKDGSLHDMRMTGSSSDIALDNAASRSITASNPFPALPAEFKGHYLSLRLYFSYNPDLRIFPPGPVTVTAGSTQQFSAGYKGKSATWSLAGGVTWSLAGDACANADCGSISPAGLYTAPAKAPDSPDITVTATQTSAPLQSATTIVRIVPPSPKK
jgi:TonB family protein